MRRELSIFYRQVGVSCRAGVPLTEGLRLATDGCRDRTLRRAAEDVLRRVRSGRQLGPALAAHPEAFRELDTALVAVGEENGRLDSNLLVLAERCEREHGERRRLAMGLLYPGGLLAAALLLPPLHVWVSSSFGTYVVVVLRTAVPLGLALGLAAAALVLVRRQATGVFDRLVLGLPVLGPSLRKLALARWSDSLATLYAAGVELGRSVRLSVAALGNRHLEGRCRSLGETLEKGGSLADALQATGVFPRELVGSVAVGETTGDLDRTLDAMARLYREEADRAIQALMILLPVVVYVLVAVYIAFVVVSAFGTYFRMIGGT